MPETKEVRQISEVEYCYGENRISLMNHNIIQVIAVGPLEKEDALAMIAVIHKFEEQIAEKINYLIDLNRAGKNSPQARNIWKERNENRITGKVALFGIHPVARVLAAFVMSVSLQDNMRFFNTREEAMNWLQE